MVVPNICLLQVSEACCVVVAMFAHESPAAAAAAPRALQLAEALVRAGVESATELWSALSSVGMASGVITGSPVSPFGSSRGAANRNIMMLDGRKPAFSPSSVSTSKGSDAQELSFPWGPRDAFTSLGSEY